MFKSWQWIKHLLYIYLFNDPLKGGYRLYLIKINTRCNHLIWFTNQSNTFFLKILIVVVFLQKHVLKCKTHRYVLLFEKDVSCQITNIDTLLLCFIYNVTYKRIKISEGVLHRLFLFKWHALWIGGFDSSP